MENNIFPLTATGEEWAQDQRSHFDSLHFSQAVSAFGLRS